MTTPTSSAPDQFLTPQQVADRYHVALKTVYKWNTNGRGPRLVRIGGSVRYRLSDLVAWETTQESA